MRIESARLAHLVTDLVDLSRLQGDDPMQYAQEVDIDSVLHEAVDSMRTTAQARNIDITVGGDHHAKVFGVESQLVTAVRNLLANAVAYSAEQTRISLGCRVAPATARSPLRIRGWEFHPPNSIGSSNASTELTRRGRARQVARVWGCRSLSTSAKTTVAAFRFGPLKVKEAPSPCGCQRWGGQFRMRVHKR